MKATTHLPERYALTFCKHVCTVARTETLTQQFES